MGDGYENEDYQSNKILEELSHTSEACSELGKAGSLPISGEESQEDYKYTPDPDMLMRKLPKKGPKIEQDLFESGIDNWKEWWRSPSIFAYGLALLSLIMAITSLILASFRCFPSCPLEWNMFQEKCYYYALEKSNWTTARHTCQYLNADLIVIGSEEVQDFLVYSITVEGLYWIGHDVIEPQNTWKWVDGSDSSYTYWADGGQENCAALATEDTYRWKKIACSNANVRFICEKRVQRACVWHHLHSSFN